MSLESCTFRANGNFKSNRSKFTISWFSEKLNEQSPFSHHVIFKLSQLSHKNYGFHVPEYQSIWLKWKIGTFSLHRVFHQKGSLRKRNLSFSRENTEVWISQSQSRDSRKGGFARIKKSMISTCHIINCHFLRIKPSDFTLISWWWVTYIFIGWTLIHQQ